MRKTSRAIDGFVPRNDDRKLGSASPKRRLDASERPHIGQAAKQEWTGSLPAPRVVSRQEIDDSLKDIDDEVVERPHKRKIFRRKQKNTAHSSRRKFIKRSILAIVVVLVLVGGYIGVKGILATGSVFKGSIFDIFQDKPLQEDANGRTNILVLGNTDDDPNHPGNDLTDTMMIVSINQKKKDAYMFSIPRDLWVNYGMACPAGYEGKINAFFPCSNEGTSEADEQDRLTKTQKFVGKIVGLDIQYSVHVNSNVVMDAVNAVDGVDIDIEGSGGAPGVLDRNFDGQCHYTCYWVKYTNGVHHLDAQHAMYLSMARGDNAPTYGLSRGNFDREINQQKILMAIKQKATTLGILANPVKVSSLLDTIGKNLRTNFSTSEIQTLVKLGREIPSDKIQRISLIDDKQAIVTTGNVGDQSVVEPVAGLYDYSQIQSFIHKSLNATDVTREAAGAALYNGSGTPGYAQTQGNKLEELGLTVTAVENAPSDGYTSVTIYDLSGGKKPATKAKLESMYNTKVTKGTSPVTPPTGTDFVIIFGASSSGN